MPRPGYYKHKAHLYIEKDTREKLRLLKKKLGYLTFDNLIRHLALDALKEELIPFASYSNVFSTTRPVIITGKSGEGKTTTTKRVLNELIGMDPEADIFVLDVSNEYSEFEKVDLGKFFSIRWNKEGQRLRFVPNSNVEISRAEAATIFAHLNFIKNSGELAKWVIVIEEGHRFSSDANLRALLIEARKFTRKLILITTDWKVYEGIAQVFKPYPLLISEGEKNGTG
jgi:DNA helicase HerA-like ATPase